MLACPPSPLALAHVPRPPAFSLKTATTDASTLLVDKVNEANENVSLTERSRRSINDLRGTGPAWASFPGRLAHAEEAPQGRRGHLR